MIRSPADLETSLRPAAARDAGTENLFRSAVVASRCDASMPVWSLSIHSFAIGVGIITTDVAIVERGSDRLGRAGFDRVEKFARRARTRSNLPLCRSRPGARLRTGSGAAAAIRRVGGVSFKRPYEPCRSRTRARRSPRIRRPSACCSEPIRLWRRSPGRPSLGHAAFVLH